MRRRLRARVLHERDDNGVRDSLGNRSQLNVADENVNKLLADFETQIATPWTLGKWLFSWDDPFTDQRPLSTRLNLGDVSGETTSGRGSAGTWNNLFIGLVSCTQEQLKD